MTFLRVVNSLPQSLQERVRVVNDGPKVEDGDFVLYWMRTAIRTEENQALNVAIEAANQLEQPLLVYQGLSEQYPFASDRHHSFILQGAKDVQTDCEQKGIRFVLHVDRPSHRGPHLKTLAQRSSMVITEEMPTEPLRSWTSQLGPSIGRPVLAVDTACIVPMQQVGKAYERAFEYRNATRKLYADRIDHRDTDSTLRNHESAEIELPFEPVDLRKVETAELVAQCQIDHAIGPVPETMGGSVAGYQRWERFKSQELASYHQRRNNPLASGASRMSPYLHYGMVAPMRIAREAAEMKGEGAEKYLDELLIWRELAYVFCHYRDDHDQLSAIPDWAMTTLAEHESDRRPAIFSWETMARGRTGDPLWDAAQQSLLVRGELHNNVRMTWGKAMLPWTADAQTALDRIIDLNHRYALDGRDPSSYGGILWCLGQFDRPFSPPQSIFGRVRERSTTQHAQRLDPTRFRQHVTRSLWESRPRIAIVGAGLSGLMSARTLADHGAEVIVLEKSRGVGGRMSTRRSAGKPSFDHGAQYFTARDERFKRYVRSWQHDGIVEPWDGRIVLIDNGKIEASRRSTERFVAVPGMNEITRHLAVDIPVELQTQATSLERSDAKWQITCEDGKTLEGLDSVIVALPSHQAADLLSKSELLATAARSIDMNGCWALMLTFESPLNVTFDAAFVNASPLSWIAKNNSKPGRESEQEAWVVHASHLWTEEHLEHSAEQVQQMLLEEFARVTGVDQVPSDVMIHRWRYAIPAEPLAEECLFNPETMIGACGDWCGGPRVEGAFLSGMAIAGRVLGQLARR